MEKRELKFSGQITMERSTQRESPRNIQKAELAAEYLAHTGEETTQVQKKNQLRLEFLALTQGWE